MLSVKPERDKEAAFSAIVPVKPEKEWGEEDTTAAVEQVAVVIGTTEVKEFREGCDIG